MNDAVRTMLDRYTPVTQGDYKNALKEIMQEIALLGLWRTKFFEHAAFYGGTALRILYDLDRFSEDLDFSLLEPNANFDLSIYLLGIATELEAYGFATSVEEKKKTEKSAIKSAFVKANTAEHLIKIDMPARELKRCHLNENLKIKIEIDTDPPPQFKTEAHYILQPTAFSVKTLAEADLFAGKLHAVLCRAWKTRVKGRDWYDMLWFIARSTPVNLTHLESRMRQSGHYTENASLTLNHLLQLLDRKIETTDINQAKKDILPFIKDPSVIDVWSKEFFQQIVKRIEHA